MNIENATPVSTRKPFKKWLGYIAGVVVLGAALIGGTHFYLKYKYTHILEQTFAQLKPDTEVTYSNLDIVPLMGRTTMSDVMVKHKGATMMRAKQLSFTALDAEGEILTRANLKADALEFSPMGADIAQATEATPDAIVKGDLQVDYSYEPSSNSYYLHDFDFTSVDQKNRLTFDKVEVTNLVKDGGVWKSFGINASDVAYTTPKASATPVENEGGDTKTLRFSSAFKYEQFGTDEGYVIRDFTLSFPDMGHNASVAEIMLRRNAGSQIPLNFSLDVKGMDLPLDTEMTPTGLAKIYGYSRLKGDARLAYAYNKDTQKIEGVIGLNFTDILSLAVRYHLSGLNLEQATKETFMASVMQQGVYVEGAEITYTDASFLRKTLEMNAAEKNLAVSDYVAQLGQAIDMQLIGPDPRTADPALVDVAGKIKTYLGSLGTLTASIRPSQPLGLGQMFGAFLLDRQRLLRSLGLSVTVS